MTFLFVALWAVCTALHFALCTRVVARRLPDATVEERVWAAVVIGVAGLLCVLHAAMLFTSLSAATVGLAFLIFHAWIRFAGVFAMPRAIAPLQLSPKELIGAALLLAIGLSWIDAASQSAAVLGPDASGYHVPAALNLARGATLVDLPATQHLYPLAGSVMSAWFLWPFESPLLVDLAQLLPFLLMVASICWLFRLLTGLPGFVWGVPLVLTLFSMPLYRALSAGSADLWFAASFVALAASLTAVHARGAWRAVDWWLAGGAAGVLIGSKTTGIVAAGLLGAVFVATQLLDRLGRARPEARLSAPASAIAGFLLACGAGGIWLVRNWWLYGSPVAPAGVSVGALTIFPGPGWEPVAFRSVMSDVVGLGGYRLGNRVWEFAAVWFAPWFLPAIALVLIYVVDLVVARSTPAERRRARTAALMLTAGAGGTLLWLIAGAPWTSLEWSRGFSLRYSLPVPTLLAVLAAASLFPLRWEWSRQERAADVMWAVALGTSCVLLWLSTHGGRVVDGLVPTVTMAWLVAAGATAVLLLRAGPKQRGRWAAAVAVGVAIAWAAPLHRRDVRAFDETAARTVEQAHRFASGQPIETNDARGLLLEAQQYERLDGAECAARRWFVLGRLEEPLVLQDDRFQSLVFYAGRDPESARRAGPVGRCEYVVTTPAIRDTDKGRAIEEALLGRPGGREVARAAGLIALAAASVSPSIAR